MTGRDFTDAERDVLVRAHEILHGRRARQGASYAVVVDVAGYLLAHPDAKPSAVAAAVRGRRQDVLQAAKDISAARGRFLSPRNRPSDPRYEP